ncbi:MAG: DNA polymerase III subunit delta' [Coriobacteriales bacterium]|jgi:DNA polymerase-3 subunit delta'
MTQAEAPGEGVPAFAPASLFATGMPGQDAARDFLAQAVAQGRVSHAYLFVGPPGSGKLDAAYALAQAVVCPDGGCGACDDCERVARRTHPDVHLLSPQSAQGYLIDQVRELIDDLSFAPIRAHRKVYIVDEADALGASCANALLKSLEEPPADVVFALLATSRDAVLPTIVSRCQVVPLRSVSSEQAVTSLSAQLAVSEAELRRAVGCCSSPSEARGFLASPERQQARRLALEAMGTLTTGDELDALRAAAKATAAAKEPFKALKDEHARTLKASAELMTAAELRALEVRQQRELAARERQGTLELFGAQRSLLRDALMFASGVDAAPSCDDFAPTARALARALGVEGVARAIGRVDEACARVRGNVSPQLAMEAMLFDIKEMLPCHS